MDYKTTGNIKGNTITLENEVPIRGRVTVIIHQDEDIISQELILSFLKKLPEWKDLFNVEKLESSDLSLVQNKLVIVISMLL